MENVKKTYIGLDFFKLIAAFMVVMIHTYPGLEFGRVGWYIPLVVPILGVPFFFSCSGFFLSASLSKNSSRWKPIKRLLLFYCIWTIIYLPFSIYLPLNPVSVGNFALDFFIYGTAYHLWFIPALIYNLLIISFVRNNKVLIITAVLLFVLGVLGSGYYTIGIKIPLIRDIIANYVYFDKFRRIFCIGLPFTILGYLIAQKMDVIESFVKTRTAQLLIITIFLYLVEMLLIFYFKLSRDVFISFSLLPLVTAFFLRGAFLPLKNPENLKRKGYISRSISNCVYFVHPLIILAIYMFAELVVRFPTLVCFITFSVSTLIGYIIIKINNPFLNKLIQ